jgi:hypothetical protein
MLERLFQLTQRGKETSSGGRRRSKPLMPVVRYNRSMSSRAEERSRGRARLIRLGEDDGAFDREFWQAVAPASRLEQVWDLVLEFQAWRGDGCQPRLQRSVLRLQRRER